jgi:hypothetical protein
MIPATAAPPSCHACAEKDVALDVLRADSRIEKPFLTSLPRGAHNH